MSPSAGAAGASEPAFLSNPGKLLLFGGKGGVGKTTCATATALHLARSNARRSVLLLSTDPAHSLRDSLGEDAAPERVTVVELQAQEFLDAFRRRHGAQLREIADRGTFLDREDVDRLLSLSLPGLDELLAFLDLARRAQESDPDDCIVVDTAPTGHTLRLLEMPGLLRGWVDALDTLLAKHRYMRAMFRGSAGTDELDRFLADLTDSIDEAEELLRDPTRCRFVPVMSAEELSLRETAALLRELDDLGIPADEVVVNALRPANECPLCAPIRAGQLETLRRLPEPFAGRTCWGVPLAPEEVRGSGALAAFWDRVEPLTIPPPAPAVRSVSLPLQVERPPPLPSPEIELLFLAGKGGVGKTTLACATALRLARERSERPVLLFSTDPAHSIGDCLDRPVGSQPMPIVEALTALEIDASAEFESVKEQYRVELDEFLGSLLGGFDLPFDREVMERLFELSPPGVDELMALARAMELLDEGRYAVFVVDAAPSGHLIRLLELPALVDEWLKALFEIFLKYRNVFHVPRVTERLVRLSRSLKRFRALLRDPRRSSLVAVSILTRMSLAETQDLAAACSRLQVPLQVLFLNLATPPGLCPFCQARARQEDAFATLFAHAFPELHRSRIDRMTDPPRGLEALDGLGRALYRH